MKLKPNKLAFLLSWFWIKLLIFSFLVLIFDKTIATILLIIAVTIIFYELWKYNKENYEILEDKIVRHYWDWFSDNSVEVQYRRIVEVKLTLPFIESLLFKTGIITISTAWGWDTIYLLHINKPQQIYNQILENLHKSWYNIWDWDLVMEMKPSTLWVLGEVVSKFVRIDIIYFLIYFFAILGPILSYLDKDKAGIIGYIIDIIVIYVFILFILTYLDYKKRTYRLYTDRIEYFEWFLTKHHAIIPIEAVSDVENQQSFFSRLMWIHDIVISSKWATNYVLFKNMTQWEKFIESIKYIKDKIHENTQKQEEKTENNLIKHKNKIEKVLNYNKDFTTKLKMNKLKALVSGIVILPSLPYKIIQMIFTTYTVDKNSIEYTLDFLSKKHASFNVENITKITITRSLLDKLFWTCSISFYSIWASFPITFYDITYSEELIKKILEKVGIYDENINLEIKPDFNLKNLILNNLPQGILLTLVLLGLIISISLNNNSQNQINSLLALVIIIIWSFIYYFYKKLYYSEKYYLAKIRESYIEIKKWIIISQHSYTHISNIKGISSTKLPTISTGHLNLNIAWETISTNWKYTYVFSNLITIEYVENVHTQHDNLDTMLNWETLDKNEIISSKPDLANYIVPLIIIWIITALAGIWLVILFIILPLTIWSVKVQKYIIENSRTVRLFWIIYKSKQSIIHKKIDFVKMERWLLNKLFWNGNVNIYTTWSTNIDMSLKNTKDYKEIYEILKKYSE